MSSTGREDDDRSSSLSEPEDVDDDDDNNIAPTFEDRDVDVQLTEELSAHQSLEVDSEAETERLEQTPHKARKQAVNVINTPSKLSKEATADGDFSQPPSPSAGGPGAASSTSTTETARKKRKRSDTAESSLTSADSDLGQSPRKRSHSSTAGGSPTAERDTGADTSETVDLSTMRNNIARDAQDAVVGSQNKPGRGRKGVSSKGKLKQDASPDTEQDLPETSAQSEEQSEEAAAKSAEETRHKQAASTMYEDLAKQFTAFREKMRNDKLGAVEAELEMLSKPDCRHPDYLRQVACVDARRQKQVKEIQALYKFKLESIRRTTLGERSQLHSQFFQYARDLRESVLTKLGDDWYNIQNERRQSHNDQDDTSLYRFPTRRSEQIKRQAKYNQEVSILSGFAKYAGFPAAPDLAGAEGDSLEDDLKFMKIKRAPNPIAAPPAFNLANRPGLIGEGQKERLAHDQFMEQNAWARPQGPIPNHGTPNLTHTPDWAAEPKLLMRTTNAGLQGTASPYSTPMAQRRVPIEQASSGTVAANSDRMDLSSSTMAAPPIADRIPYGTNGQMSPLTMTKHRQADADPSGPGFRNISNMSSASTIDAPPDSAEKERQGIKESLMGISSEASAPQHVFEVRQPEGFANATFRPQEGAFGTPTPL